MKNKAFSTHFDKLSDLQESIGKEIGLSDWILIDQQRINEFANTTEDRQWIHTNPELSKSFSPYGSTVAHGFLVLSFAPKIAYETITVGDVVMGVNYGCDKVRFPNATVVGSKVRGRIALLDYSEIPNGARYKFRITFELEGQEKPSCVAEMIAQAYVGPKKQAEQVQMINKMADKAANEKQNEVILYEVVNKVATITLNRPDNYNGINQTLLEELYRYLLNAKMDEEVRAIILRGNGKGFCAGADMSDLGTIPKGELTREFLNYYYQSVLRLLVEIPKPIIAAIHGSAAGAGAGLALACDLRVMAYSSSFAFVFSNIGLNTDNGSAWLLARTVGYSKAFEYTIGGNKIPADECILNGLTNKICREDELYETAFTWAKQLVEKAPIALANQKEILHHALNHSLFESFAMESKYQASAINSDDFKEGIQAFMEKRSANFKGK